MLSGADAGRLGPEFRAMWQKLSLRARLNLLVACIMLLGLAINIARLLLEASSNCVMSVLHVVRILGAILGAMGPRAALASDRLSAANGRLPNGL